MNKERSAIVLMSGGQDSTTCLYWALKKFELVYAIGFDYGQSHKAELKQAEAITKRLGIPYKVYDIKELLSGSSLTDGTSHDSISTVNDSLPGSFTAGRNLLFLTIAASYAANRNIKDVVIGVCETDYAGYPDCRRNTIDAQQLALSLGLGIGDVRIHTPLMYLSKAETWRLAEDLNCLDVIIEDTLTDYDADRSINEWGYGNPNNPASRLRMLGYYEAKEKGWI